MMRDVCVRRVGMILLLHETIFLLPFTLIPQYPSLVMLTSYHSHYHFHHHSQPSRISPPSAAPPLLPPPPPQGIQQMLIGSIWVVGPAVGGILAETYGYRNSFFIAGGAAALCSLGYSYLPETLRKIDPTDTGKDTATNTAANTAANTTATGKDTAATDTHTAAAEQSVLLSEPNKATAHPAHIANATLLDRGREWTREWRTEMRGILNDPNQQALIAYACIQPLRFSCFATATVLHLTDVIDAGPQQIGIMFTLMALGQGLSTPIGATLADRMKPGTARTALVVPALFGSQVAFASLAFVSDPAAVYTAVLLQGVATGLVASAVGAFSAEVTPQATRGQAMSLQRQAGSSLALFSPIALGLLADCSSRPVAIVATSSVMAACTFGYMYLATKAERAAEEEEAAANREERGA